MKCLTPTIIQCLLLSCINIQSFTIKPYNKTNCHNAYNNSNMNTNGELDVMKHIIKKGMLIFDVGANIGEWTQNVQNLHRNNTIFAFEPIPTSFAKLSGKYESKSVSCFNVGLGKRSKTQDIYVYDGVAGSRLCSFYYRPILEKLLNKKPYIMKVPVVTLDAFCQQHNINHIDYLKIDTEGAELDVLLGARQLLSSHKIDYIQFEYGGAFQDAQTTLKSVYNLLTSNGYHVFIIAPKGLIYLEKWSNEYENYQHSNCFAIHAKKIDEHIQS